MKEKLKKMLKVIGVALLLLIILVIISAITHVASELAPIGTVILGILLLLFWSYLIVNN